MAIVDDIAIAMTVAMAIDNALADATAVVIVPPYPICLTFYMVSFFV